MEEQIFTLSIFVALGIFLKFYAANLIDFFGSKKREQKKLKEWPEKIDNNWVKEHRDKEDVKNKLFFIRAYNVLTYIPLLFIFGFAFFVLQPHIGVLFSNLLILPISFLVSNYVSKGIFSFYRFIEGPSLDNKKLDRLTFASSTNLTIFLFIVGQIFNNTPNSDILLFVLPIYLATFFSIESFLVYLYTRT